MKGENFPTNAWEFGLLAIAIGAGCIAVGRNWHTIRPKIWTRFATAVDQMSRSYIVLFLSFVVSLSMIVMAPLLIRPTVVPNSRSAKTQTEHMLVNNQVIMSQEYNNINKWLISYRGNAVSSEEKLRFVVDFSTSPDLDSPWSPRKSIQIDEITNLIRGQSLDIQVVGGVEYNGEIGPRWGGKSFDVTGDYNVSTYLNYRARLSVIDSNGVEQHHYFMIIAQPHTVMVHPNPAARPIIVRQDDLNFQNDWEGGK